VFGDYKDAHLLHTGVDLLREDGVQHPLQISRESLCVRGGQSAKGLRVYGRLGESGKKVGEQPSAIGHHCAERVQHVRIIRMGEVLFQQGADDLLHHRLTKTLLKRNERK